MLALANWPRVDANDFGGAPGYAAPEPRGRVQLRARLDLQGVHRGRRAARTASSRPTSSFTCRRRSRSPTATIGEAARARADRPDHVRRSSPSPATSARSRIGLRSGARASTAGCGASASAGRPASTSRARSAGQVLQLERVLGLVDGQPADRPGRVRHAAADGDRLRGDRQRRHPAPPARRRARRRRRASTSPRAGASSPRRRPRSVRKMLEGVVGAGGTASEVAIPGYSLAGKTGTANKIDSDDRRVLGDALHRLVRRLRAGARPAGCSSR